MSKKIAVILCGCGFKDGSEIHEATLTLLGIAQTGATAHCFAPNVPQATVTNHLTGDAEGAARNMLVESARIARGNVQDITQLHANNFDALILPGGFGAALNLCTFATKGAQCQVNPDVARVVTEFHAAKKPIGAICIAPAIVANVLGAQHVKLTIGTDSGTAQQLEAMGAVHEKQSVENICVDETHRIVSTPAYMLANNIAEANAGISKLVTKIVEMCGAH